MYNSGVSIMTNIKINPKTLTNRKIKFFFVSLMILISFTTAMVTATQISEYINTPTLKENSSEASQVSYTLFQNTTSGEFGDYFFTNVPNGDYLVKAVQYSTAGPGMWLTNVSEITIANGTKIEGLNLSMRNNTNIDHQEILGLFDRTTISGKTISKTGANKTYVDVALTTPESKFVTNTTSNEFGDYFFTNVPNGDYLVKAVQYSTAGPGMWLTNVSEITIANGTKIEGLNLSMRNNTNIDHQEILGLFDRTTISGKTISKTGANKTYVDLALTTPESKFVTNTTSDGFGDYFFTNVPNGDYLVKAVQYSTAGPGMWLTNVSEITIANGTKIEGLNLSMRNNTNIDHQEILGLFDRTTISGKTISKTGANKTYVDIALLNKLNSQISNAPHLNISIVTGYTTYDAELAEFMERINSNSELNITVNVYITTTAPETLDLNQSDIVLVITVTQSASKFENAVSGALENGAIVIGENTYLPESNYTVPSDFEDANAFKAYLLKYWSGAALNNENFDNLIFYLAREYYNRTDLTVEEPAQLVRAIYHPAMNSTYTGCFESNATKYFEWYSSRTDGHKFDPDAPTVGIIFYNSYYPDDMDPIDKLLNGFEEKGANVIACYGDSSNYVDCYFNYSNETKVDAIDSFLYRGNYFDPQKLGVPVINALFNGYMNTSQWVNSSNPLPTANMLRIYRPETLGSIDPIMVAALETFTEGNDTVEKYIGKDEQVDWLINRTVAQANLSLINESNKKVAIIYYNHGGGKNNIKASYLEVAPSIVNLLTGMADEGYDVNNSFIPNKTELIDLMLYQGRNIGTWAPGELDALVKTGKAVLVPESTYLSWFNELPKERRDEVIEMWGEPPGKIMVYTDDDGNKFIVIPKISLSDNVILAPQPTRGWLQDNEVLYHDTDLPPHHQYIAFYMWLQHEFGADVMINMGRHGTVEWLPGKEFCLLNDEWPALMNGNIPVVYPYVMDGMGEGMQAKRRGNAVIIDHLIPPVVSAGLYGNYSVLSSDIASYQTSSTDSNSTTEAHLQEILNLTIELGLDEQVNMSLAENNETIDEFLEELDDVLTELKSQSMPYGLHVLGEAPAGEALVGMVNSMLGDGFSEMVATYNSSDSAPTDLLSLVLLENVSTTEAQVRVLGNSNASIEEELNTSINYAQLLGEADEEVQQVLNAMDGKYISPNLGGDPVLRPETLPSGRNFYAFDEQVIPTQQAWNEGTELLDQWLQEYNDTNNGYPHKVSYILWAGESTRHEGVMEAQILYLLGVKPVWGSSNKVTGIELINSSELKRPRIDVVVEVSGLYRDSFPMKIELIDQAVRLAYAQAGTDEYPNYVAQDTDALQATWNETIKNGSLSLDIAQFRVFGPADGAYGTGMKDTVESSDTWENNTKLAELYINKMCYIYGQNIWGQTISDYIKQQSGQSVELNNSVVYEGNLNGTQAIFHSRTSNTYGSIDTDDFYQYLGGLYNAINYVSETAPEAYVLNLQDLDDMKIQTLQTYIANELYARYFNSKWISGMQLSGYEGAEVMDSFVENLWGWEALYPDLISNDVWNQVYETYVTNTELSSWLKETNPYAYQSIVARMIETIRKENWDASEEIAQNLAKEYAESVVEDGVTCCHHTCGNPFLDSYIQNLISVPGVVSKETAEEYKRLMEEATQTGSLEANTGSSGHSSGNTGNPEIINSTSTSQGNQTAESGGGYGTNVEQAPAPKSSAQASDYVEGYEMTTESTQKESGGMSFSGADLLGAIFVVFCLGGIYAGFHKKNK